MSRRLGFFVLCLLALSAASAEAWALGDTEVTANQGVAAGGNITGDVTIGLPPAQIQALVITFTQQIGVATEARAKAEAQAAQVAAELGFTQNAVVAFFRILGEQDVPVEQMPTKLGEIAQRYRDLLTQLKTTGSTDPEVQRLKEQAERALDTGDFARTEELLNQAKARDLAAIEQMQATLAQLQADLDARKLSAADAAAQNGDLMMTQIRYMDAARYYAEAVKLTSEKYAEQLSKHLTSLSEAAGRGGDYRLGLDAAQRALTLDETRLPADNIQIGRRLYYVAEFYKADGHYAEAEKFTIRAISIGEKAPDSEHVNLAEWLGSLVDLYRETGRYGEAEPLARRAVDITEKELGPQNSAVADQLNGLGLLQAELGRYAEAETLLKRAIAINKATIGSDHPDSAKPIVNLATVYQATGRVADAESLFRRALSIWESVLGPNHPYIASGSNNLAQLYDATGRYAEAEPLYRRAIAITEKAFGPEHPDLAIWRNNLATNFWSTGRYAEAEPLFQSVLAIMVKSLPPDHPNLATARENYAAVLDALGRREEAAALRAEAETIRQQREQVPPR